MKKTKKLLCLVLALMTLMSMCVFGMTAQAADTEIEEVAATLSGADDFTWDNATVYFLLTDRFKNGNTSNDNSYNRNKDRNGNVVNINNVAAFQGGDFKGITQKINEGYFDDLGVNAIWVSGWFEQTHGYVVGGDGKKSFPHYSYHGYYGLDFTELDKNYGTEAEFKEMIDAAHSRGIRVVLDVVMNHPGYNSIYDMNEYGFGTLTGNAMDVYYNFDKINQTNYHGCIKYNDGQASDWAKWWGRDWIRAGMAGYDNNGAGNALTEAVTYLPDFKTESGATVNLPEILKTKWTREGTYNTKVNEINQTFSKYNLGNKTVTNYLVAWYAKWVEEYGVDGFRCDTAKHVGLDAWNKLSTACTQALKNWRQANPNAIGADWDEDFWMTGENFGQGLSNNDYYRNGFDSMINFSFSGDSQGNGCNGLKKTGNLNQTYADYANQINNNANFNVLTYISSHDTGLCRDDLYYQGSALLLLPGGVQIFYGDETNRQYVECSIHDHESRSMMNWNSLDNGVLAHWQKVGQFRNNHVAVGAGSHTNLTASSGTAFARTYNKNGVKDSVACVIGASKNSQVTITLNNTFANGVTVKNTYTGDTATVQGGKVTFNSGSQGTILVELAENAETPTQKPTETPTQKPTETPTQKPTQKPTETPVGPAEYVVLGDTDLSGNVNVKDATLVQKFAAGLEDLADKNWFAGNVDKSETVNVKDATAIQKFCAGLNSGYAVGDTVVYKEGTDLPETPTQKPEIPTQAPEIPTETPSLPSDDYMDLTQIDGQIIILTNSSYGTPYQHCWTDGGNPHNTWPGDALQQVGNYYFAIIPDEANRIIFNDGNGAQTDDLVIPGEFAIYDMTAGSWAGFLSDFVDVTKFPVDPSLLPNNPITPPTPDNPVDPPVADGNYIYVRDAANWGSVYCHYWSGSSGSVWPGDQMENMGNGIFRFAIGNDYTGAPYQNVVFNNGSGTQTSDLTVEIGKTFNNQSNAWE